MIMIIVQQSLIYKPLGSRSRVLQALGDRTAGMLVLSGVV